LFDEYSDLDSINVTIHSKYELLETNADEINGFNYTWIIDKDNAYQKNIYLSLNTDKRSRSFFEFLEEKGLLVAFILFILIAVGGTVFYLMKKHSEKVDEI